VNFKDFVEEDRRLVILLLLREAGGKANESVLHSGATAVGHATVSRSQLRKELEWLRERGLVTHEWYNQTVLVASLTERGLDTAEGREHVQGVKRPSIVRGS
jgi:hypothetical protein